MPGLAIIVLLGPLSEGWGWRVHRKRSSYKTHSKDGLFLDWGHRRSRYEFTGWPDPPGFPTTGRDVAYTMPNSRLNSATSAVSMVRIVSIACVRRLACRSMAARIFYHNDRGSTSSPCVIRPQLATINRWGMGYPGGQNFAGWLATKALSNFCEKF